jgi:hypothetical protein
LGEIVNSQLLCSFGAVGGFWWFWRRFLGIAILGDEIMVTLYPSIQVVQLLSSYTTNYRLPVAREELMRWFGFGCICRVLYHYVRRDRSSLTEILVIHIYLGLFLKLMWSINAGVVSRYFAS